MNAPTPEQQAVMIQFIVLLFAAIVCVKLLWKYRKTHR